MRANRKETFKLRKRELRVQVGKVGEDNGPETTKNGRPFEDIADAILDRLESVGAKVFLGLCIYVVLDTYRQTQIERVKQQSSET
jgi:hypothetical protein